MRHGVDFDGVLAYDADEKIRFAREYFGAELQPEQCNLEDSKQMLGEDRLRIMIKVLNSGPATLRYKVPEHCAEVISELRQHGHLTLCITSRQADEYMLARQFIVMYQLPIGHILYTRKAKDVLDKQAKADAKREVIQRLRLASFVDDAYYKLLPLSGLGLKLFLFDQPWNRRVEIDCPDVQRVFGWKDYASRINAL